MNKPGYLRLSILELSKILMYAFWYDYVILMMFLCMFNDEKAKLCYTGSFIVYIKTDDIYKDIAEDFETRFDTSNYELDRALPKGKNKQKIGLMKDELSGKILIKVVGLTAKTYSYLIDEGSEDKKAKDTRMCVIKRELKFEINKDFSEAIQRDNEIEYLEKNKFNVDSLKRNHKEFVKN